MSDTSIAEVRVRETVEGRKIAISLRPETAAALSGGRTIQLSYGDPQVDFEDPLSSAGATPGNGPLGVVEITLDLLHEWE